MRVTGLKRPSVKADGFTSFFADPEERFDGSAIGETKSWNLRVG
jgi:hypothetical protein